MRTLAELRAVIGKEGASVNSKPYSHNIIGIVLRTIARNYGQAEADKAIVDFKLYKKGWAAPKKKEAKP